MKLRYKLLLFTHPEQTKGIETISSIYFLLSFVLFLPCISVLQKFLISQDILNIVLCSQYSFRFIHDFILSVPYYPFLNFCSYFYFCNWFFPSSDPWDRQNVSLVASVCVTSCFQGVVLCQLPVKRHRKLQWVSVIPSPSSSVFIPLWWFSRFFAIFLLFFLIILSILEIIVSESPSLIFS